MIELSLRYTDMTEKISLNTKSIKRPVRVSYMEGSLDMVHQDKVATVKAVFHPRKTLIR